MSLDLGKLVLTLEVDDRIPAGLAAANRRIDQFATVTGKQGTKAGQQLGEGLTTGAERKLRDSKGRFVGSGEDAGRSTSEGLERGLKPGHESIGALVGRAGLGLIGVQAIRTGLQTAAGMETARIGFTTMLGSAKKADVFLKQLADFAAKTPFEFPELQTAASSLISAGISADKVIPIMRTLGDVTTGVGTGADGVQRATVALQQMSAAGRITGEDLGQLRDAGIPVYDLLAAATNRSKQEVVELAQAGKLGRTELDLMMHALETGDGLERFNGLMEQTSTSLTGLWSTLQDTFSQGMASAIQPSIPLIKAGLGGAIKLVDGHLDKLIFLSGLFFTVWTVRKLAGIAGGLAEVTTRFGGLSRGLAASASIAGGPWGVAIGVGVTLLGAMALKQKAAQQETKAFTDALEYQSGALDENSRKTLAKKLADEGALAAARRAGIGEKEFFDALVRGGAARQDMINQLRAISAEHTTYQTTGYSTVRSQDAVGASADKARETLLSLGAGLDASAGSARDYGRATGELGSAQDKTKGKTKALDHATKDLLDAFTLLKDGALGQERANAAWERSLDGVKASVKDNGRSLSEHTEKGRANRESILDMVEALNEKTTEDFKSTEKTKGLKKATDEATGSLKTGRKSILDAAEAAGLNRKAVEKMIDKMLKTPKELRTRVSAPGVKQSTDAVDGLGKAVKKVKDQKADVDIKVNTSLNDLNKALVKKYGRGAKLIELAGGGQVPGYSPHSKADNIPAMLTAREYVHPVDTVNHYGVDVMDAMRAKRIPREAFQHHADGGIVGRSITVNGSSRGGLKHYDAFQTAATLESALAANAYGKAIASAAVKGMASAQSSVGHVDNPHGRTSWRGGTFSNLFLAGLKAAEKSSGVHINVYQGGFRHATSYSGTSHRGDALDSQPAASLIRALRRVGIASGDRTGLGNWMSHAHSVPTKGHGYAGGSAVWQAQDYLRRGGPSQSLRSPWGLWTGTEYASPGIHETAEDGSELVVNRQFMRYKGGERVLGAGETEQLFRDAKRGRDGGTWRESPLIGKLEQNFPQSMTAEVAGEIAGSRVVATLEALGG